MPEAFDPYYRWLGIPPEEQPPNYYRLLGIKWFEDNTEVISAAADRQVLHLRTYQIGEYSQVSQRLLGEVISAKLCLLDAKKKAVYDQRLLEGDLQKSLEAAKSSRSPAFGPSLESLFDEAQQAQTFTLPRMSFRRIWFIVRQCLKRLFVLAVVLLAIFALYKAAAWLADSVMTRMGGESEPVELSDGVPQAPRPVAESSEQQATPDDQTTSKAQKLSNNAPATEQFDLVVDEKVWSDRASAKKRIHNKPSRWGDESTVRTNTNSTKQARLNRTHKGQLPLPTAEQRQKARDELERRYHISSTRSKLDKLRLAKQLSQSKAARSTSAAAAPLRYELLDQASRLAAAAGNCVFSMRIIDKIAKQFQIDPLAAKQARLVEAVALANEPEHLKQLSKAAVEVIDDAMKQNRFDAAQRTIDIVLPACKDAGGKQFRQTLIERRRDVRRQRQQQEEIEQAESKLQSLPEDAEANLFLGTYYCFENNDWQLGLEYLAKGNDAGLTEVAQIELENPPQTADEKILLGDAWWKLATTKFGKQKKPLLLRAAHWYRQAQRQLTSGNQARHVDRRLETIIRLTSPAVK